jgi:hypothetical protein
MFQTECFSVPGRAQGLRLADPVEPRPHLQARGRPADVGLRRHHRHHPRLERQVGK